MSGNLILENTVGEVSLSRQFVSGGAAPGRGQWKLMRLSEPNKVVMPAEMKLSKSTTDGSLIFDGDRLSPRWENKYNWMVQVREWTTAETIKSDSVVTDNTGQSTIKLPALKSGAYRMVYTSKDSFGELIESQAEFFVANRIYRPVLPGLFLADKSTVKVNEKINFWLPTGLQNQTVIFEVFQDNKILERRYLNSTNDPVLIEWTMTEAYRGGLSFVVRFLNDYQALSFDQTIFVPWDNKQISIETKTFRDRLRPGQNEKWTVKLLGPDKKKLQKASVQLLAYMYDRSLDQLAPHYSPSLLSIYPNRSGANAASFQLGPGPQAYFQSSYSSSMESVYVIEDSFQFYSSYGIGGPGSRGGMRLEMDAAPAEMALMKSESVSKASGAESPMAPQFAANSSRSEILKEKKSSATSADKTDTSTEAVQVRSQFAETAFFLPNLTRASSAI